jgi:pimeloyl-ACP methyl ester carboxylesterase
MAKLKRLFKSFSKLLLPVLLLIVVAILAASVWLSYETSKVMTSAYLVTPEKYGQLSARGAQITDETWTNSDGTTSRGWLLKGTENTPAVILFHSYGADRSHVLNLGVKINEATNFTILMPDERGHGENPVVKNTTFGGAESEDALAAIAFLRGLKNSAGANYISQNIGVYGVEMGAIAAFYAAAKDENVKALIADSVPNSSDDIVASAVAQRFPFLSNVTSKLAQTGTYFYFFDGSYKRENLCNTAKSVASRKVLLLAGSDAPKFQDSTVKLIQCFPESSKIDARTDLSPSGYSIINASIEQSESYDQKVIEFFRANLSN